MRLYKPDEDRYASTCDGATVLIDDTSSEKISSALNKLLEDEMLYRRLEANCKNAAEELCWENEEKILLKFYEDI